MFVDVSETVRNLSLSHLEPHLSSISVSPRINEKGGDLAGAQSVKFYQGVGACTYSIHSLDVLRLILSYIYLICALPFVIIGLVKGGERPPFRL